MRHVRTCNFTVGIVFLQVVPAFKHLKKFKIMECAPRNFKTVGLLTSLTSDADK